MAKVAAVAVLAVAVRVAVVVLIVAVIVAAVVVLIVVLLIVAVVVVLLLMAVVLLAAVAVLIVILIIVVVECINSNSKYTANFQMLFFSRRAHSPSRLLVDHGANKDRSSDCSGSLHIKSLHRNRKWPDVPEL